MIGESGGREQGGVLSSGARKALKMLVVQVVAFILCWTPYTVMNTWSVSVSAQDFLLLYEFTLIEWVVFLLLS